MARCIIIVNFYSTQNVFKIQSRNKQLTHVLSSSFSSPYPKQAELSNGIKILWDGRTRAYVTVPPSFHGQTKGLCGTFDGNQKNDYLTPDGDVVVNERDFGNRWKTNANCENLPLQPQPNPCDIDPQRKQQAQDMCQKLQSDVFKRKYFSSFLICFPASSLLESSCRTKLT